MLPVVITLTALSTALSAHDVPPEPTVDAFIQSQPGRLLVLLRVPTAVLVDASLPRLVDGTLSADGLREALGLVGASIADNLEVRHADAALARPAITPAVSPLSDRSFATFSGAVESFSARRTRPIEALAATEAFVDLEMVYAVPMSAGDPGGFSARLDVFSTPGQPVRVVARYETSSGEQTVSVRRSTERVLFDPDRIEVVRQFSVRALQVLFGGGDYLLLIACLVVQWRRAQDVAALLLASAAAQIAVVLATRAPLAPATLVVVQVVTASGIVIASIQNIVAARLRWVRPLVVVFGLLHGLSLGDSVTGVAGFAGRHGVLATATFLAALELAAFWIAAVFWLSVRWLNDRGVSDRAQSILVSAVVAHTAIHRMTDIGQAYPAGLERLLISVTLGWAAVMLLVALIEALTSGLRRGQSSVVDNRTVP
jgi:HupE / UreJ protein